MTLLSIFFMASIMLQRGQFCVCFSFIPIIVCFCPHLVKKTHLVKTPWPSYLNLFFIASFTLQLVDRIFFLLSSSLLLFLCFDPHLVKATITSLSKYSLLYSLYHALQVNLITSFMHFHYCFCFDPIKSKHTMTSLSKPLPFGFYHNNGPALSDLLSLTFLIKASVSILV